MIKIRKQSAFTLVELLVVIAIIGLIATLSVIVLGNARSKSRDSKRVSDIKQVQTALELFFSDQGRYPTVTEWNTGSLYATGTLGTTTYIAKLPNDPNNLIYKYASRDNGANYEIIYYLENNSGSLNTGLQTATALGQVAMGTSDGLQDYWNFNEGAGTTFYNNSFYGTSTGTVSTNGLFVNSYNNKLGTALSEGIISSYKFPEANNQITISLWLKWTYKVYCTPVYGNNSYRFYFRGDWAGLKIYFMRHIDESVNVCDSAWWTWAAVSSNTDFADNTWYHVVGVRDGNNLKLYVNGVLEKNSTCLSSVTPTNYNNENITVNSTCASDTYTDDLRVYNRALSSAEILDIYNSTK